MRDGFMAKTKASPSPDAAATDTNGPVLVMGAMGSLGLKIVQDRRDPRARRAGQQRPVYRPVAVG